PVPVDRARIADRLGKVRDLDPADLIGLRGRESPALVVLVDGHAARLTRLAVRAVAPAVRAVLLQLEPVRVVTPVLLGDVVAVLALLAGQGDLGPDVGGSHDGVPFSAITCAPKPEQPAASQDSRAAHSSARRPRRRGTGIPACGAGCRALVAEAGLEPATQRL